MSRFIPFLLSVFLLLVFNPDLTDAQNKKWKPNKNAKQHQKRVKRNFKGPKKTKVGDETKVKELSKAAFFL